MANKLICSGRLISILHRLCPGAIRPLRCIDFSRTWGAYNSPQSYDTNTIDVTAKDLEILKNDRLKRT